MHVLLIKLQILDLSVEDTFILETLAHQLPHFRCIRSAPSGQSNTDVVTIAQLNNPSDVQSLNHWTGSVYMSKYNNVSASSDSPYSPYAPAVTTITNGGYIEMVDSYLKKFMIEGPGKENFYLEMWVSPSVHKNGDFFKSPLISHSNPSGSPTRSTFAWDYRGNGVFNDPGGYGIYTTNISGYMDGNNTDFFW